MLPTAVKDIPYLMLEEIDFSSAEKRMKCSTRQAPFIATKLKPPTDDDFFTEIAEESTSKPVILSLVAPHNDQFAQSSDQLPLPLQTIFSTKHLQLNYVQLLGLAKDYIPKSLTINQQEHLEELTRLQSKSKLWFKYRAGRITGSQVYQVVRTDPHKPALSTVSTVCYPEACQFTSAATNYGCQHEEDVVKAYKQLQSDGHDQPLVTPCGFIVSVDKPLIGASPDAFVECKCCGHGVLEVKCPFCARSSTTMDLPKFYLAKAQDGSLHLKHDHAYYYQCQLELYATQRSYCDFVVWTEDNLHIERISKNETFLKEIIPWVEKFFKLCVT